MSCRIPVSMAVEAAEDEHWPVDACRQPAVLLLQMREDVVETFAEIREDVVVVEGDAMTGMHRGGGAADENRVGDQPQQACGGGEDRRPL